MKTYPTLKEAQEAQDAGEVFVLINRRNDNAWDAYELGDPIPDEE